MLKAIVDGESDPHVLAALAVGNARKKQVELVEALRGRATTHHRTIIKLHLGLVDAINAALDEVDAAAGKALEPIQARAILLTTMPGVSDIVANVIVAEIGVDMSRFPTSGHLVSWAGLCPRNDESAGKRRSTKLRKGGSWLKTTLVTVMLVARLASAVLARVSAAVRALFMNAAAMPAPTPAMITTSATLLTIALRRSPARATTSLVLSRSRSCVFVLLTMKPPLLACAATIVRAPRARRTRTRP
jgi:hypothetical protein